MFVYMFVFLELVKIDIFEKHNEIIFELVWPCLLEYIVTYGLA